MTFMAELSNIATKILKKSHLSTNITEKSSEDLIDSPACEHCVLCSYIVCSLKITIRVKVYSVMTIPYSAKYKQQTAFVD